MVDAEYAWAYVWCFAGSGWNGGLEQALWLPEFDRPLGQPSGPATIVAPHVYERTFEHVHVHVNMTDCAATKLTWHS